jgi:hypothetical protein
MGKTSPGGDGLSRYLERPSEPPVAEHLNASPDWPEATEGEEQRFVHGFGCWLKEMQAHQAFGTPNTQKTRKPPSAGQQGEMSR